MAFPLEAQLIDDEAVTLIRSGERVGLRACRPNLCFTNFPVFNSVGPLAAGG